LKLSDAQHRRLFLAGTLAWLGGVALTWLHRPGHPVIHDIVQMQLSQIDVRLLLAFLVAIPAITAAEALRRRKFALAGVAAAAAVGAAVFFRPELASGAVAFRNDFFQRLDSLGSIAVLASTPWSFLFGALGPIVAVFLLALRTGWPGFLFFSWLGVAVALYAGWKHHLLPPAYHDEYAYVLQAETLLGGRLAEPATSDLAPYKQMHVLTYPAFASRYFPGTAILLAPFVAGGVPWAFGWTVAGLTCGFLYLAGREHSPAAGCWTGLLAATAPMSATFANVILSSGPTILAFAVFLWAAGPSLSKRNPWRPLLAGLAMAFAFLCRPVTAAALGLPYALYFGWRAFHRTPADFRRRFVIMTYAFFCVAAALLPFNFASTGDPLETAYSRYIRVFTPSHVYGFYNVERGKAARGAYVETAYDDWALKSDECTPTTAPRIGADRAVRFLAGGMGGLATFGALAVLAFFALAAGDDRELLAALSILGLWLAYLPYWFEGLFGFSYFAEAFAPFCLLVGVALAKLIAALRAAGFPVTGLALGLLPVVRSLFTLVVTLPLQFAPGSELIHPRNVQQQIVDTEAGLLKSAKAPILLLFDADPRVAVHSTLVHNSPRRDGPVVRAWYRDVDVAAVMAEYPERNVYKLRNDGAFQGFGVDLIRPRLQKP